MALCRIRSFLFRLLTKEYAPRTLRVSSRFFPGNARTIDKSRLVKADLNASLKGASEQNTTQELEREHFTQENISKQEEYFTFTKHKHNTTQGEIIKTEPEMNGPAKINTRPFAILLSFQTNCLSDVKGIHFNRIYTYVFSI